MCRLWPSTMLTAHALRLLSGDFSLHIQGPAANTGAATLMRGVIKKKRCGPSTFLVIEDTRKMTFPHSSFPHDCSRGHQHVPTACRLHGAKVLDDLSWTILACRDLPPIAASQAQQLSAHSDHPSNAIFLPRTAACSVTRTQPSDVRNTL